MKTIPFLLYFAFVLSACSGPKVQSNHNMHPLSQIESVKNHIKQQTEPYYSAYVQLLHYADSILHVSENALEDFAVPGYYDDPVAHRANSLALQRDAFAAYCSALAWQLSGEKKYGKKACYFLDAWAKKNTKYSEHDGVLVMTYSGSALLIGAELMMDSKLWPNESKQTFKTWVSTVYQPAANEIRVHKNNWADWGRFGSLLAASLLDDKAEAAENIRLIKSDLFDKIAPDGHMPHEVIRGDNGIWYTYFALAPMTAACWVAYNYTGENLFELQQNGTSIKTALDYLLHYALAPQEWPWHSKPNQGSPDLWPGNLLEAMSGIYKDNTYSDYVKDTRPIIYPLHHFAWTFPTLMPLSFD